MFVDKFRIWDACDSVNQRGERVTYERVRAALGGRGSYTTIAEGIKTWHPKDGPVETVPPEVEEHVTSFAVTIMTLATREAEARFSVERQELKEKLRELEIAIADYHADLQRTAQALDKALAGRPSANASLTNGSVNGGSRIRAAPADPILDRPVDVDLSTAGEFGSQ